MIIVSNKLKRYVVDIIKRLKLDTYFDEIMGSAEQKKMKPHPWALDYFMKKYKVTITLSHESFGGYDHNDGEKEYFVEARNWSSARKKVFKIIDKEKGGYEHTLKEIENIEDENDGVYFG